MTFNDYQAWARTTAVYPGVSDGRQNLAYPTMGLAGEAGEVANTVKKIYRDGNGTITEEVRLRLLHELGDVLWYAAALASELDLNLDDVAATNVTKLASRRDRGTLGGSGEDR